MECRNIDINYETKVDGKDGSHEALCKFSTDISEIEVDTLPDDVPVNLYVVAFLSGVSMSETICHLCKFQWWQPETATTKCVSSYGSNKLDTTESTIVIKIKPHVSLIINLIQGA